MTEQIQRQPQRTKREEEPVEEQEFDRTGTDEVLAECDNCLSNIDDVLEEVKDRRLTDEEVYAKGDPDDWDSDVVDAMTGAEYDEAMDRYAEVYENVTGLPLSNRDDGCWC